VNTDTYLCQCCGRVQSGAPSNASVWAKSALVIEATRVRAVGETISGNICPGCIEYHRVGEVQL
jgi:hypothetical protein